MTSHPKFQRRTASLRPAVERLGRMKKRIVIELDEGLERHAEPAAVIQDGMVMVGDSPGPGIEIEAFVERASLRGAAEFGEGIPAAQGPVAAACPAVELENPHLVSGLAQLQCRRHAGKAGAEDENGSAPGIAVELDRTLVSGIGREPQAGHRVIHRGAAGNRSDQGQQITPANG